MLTRSYKSVHTIRSVSTAEDGSTSTITPVSEVIPLVFEQLLPYICKKFNCDFNLHIKKELRRDGVHRYKKSDAAEKKKHTEFMSSPLPEGGEDAVAITVIYDNDRLTEIFINNQKRVPRLLMQAINEISSLYEDLNKITIRHSKIEATTVYEVNKLLSTTFITDICLDGSFIKEGNFGILLDNGTFLKQLSLCRCFITDVVCQTIVSKLHFPFPAEKTLLILNLSGNCVTDEGARSIGVMLRSNRNLRYLNLAGNRIEDEGALSILDALKEFPLTLNEIDEKQRRLFAYLKRKNALTNKFMNECEMQLASSDSLETVPKDSIIDEDEARQRAKLLANELIGRLQGPYYSKNINKRDGWPYCIGNFTLSYLNLAYNNLSYMSVKAVLGVLRYQAFKDTGLFKVILESNPMPKICTEYGDISTLINKKLVKKIKPQLNRKQRLSSRVSGNAKK